MIITFEPSGRQIDLNAGESVLSAAQRVGIPLNAVCAGNGTCGQCKVALTDIKHQPALTQSECGLLSTEEIAQGIRLACQIKPVTDLRVALPTSTSGARQQLVISRIQGQLVEPDEVGSVGGYGLAVDLGSTKLALYLVELATGKTVADLGVINPQISYGEDVVSRIAYANQGSQQAGRLQQVMLQALNAGVGTLCLQAGVMSNNITSAVIAGNTAMHHLLLGLPVQQLGAAPYIPAQIASITMPAEALGLYLGQHGRVYFPPNIAGYVGGDHVAALLVAEMADHAKPCVIVDIGTNTEISLLSGHGLWSCSTASGPAFEGAHIRDGMRAAEGAIDEVRILDGKLTVHTIGGQPAAGLCGTGILSAVAEMVKDGVVMPNGRLNKTHALVQLDDRGQAWLALVPAATSAHDRAIGVTRGDVNEIQLAKAAIRAGIDILLKEAGLTANEVKSWVLAGAFGSYLNPADAIALGMFPPVPLAWVVQVGNAAGMGARTMLVSGQACELGEALARQSQYIELTTYPGFSEIYIVRMTLGEG